MVIVLVLIIAALFFPPIQRNIKVMDMLFVIDITQSMNVQDVEINNEQVSRLEWAKDFTRNTLLALPCGSHAGLAVFSESRSLILINPIEVCQNYHDLSQMLAKIDGPMAWEQSSEVSKAVYIVIKQAQLITPEPTIIFISDGHESPPLHKSLYPKFTGKIGEINGVLLGVGGDDLLAIPKRDADGEPIGVWGINEVLHQDVYISSRGDFKEINARKAKTEHLSSQKKTQLQELANRVGFDYISSPKNPKELVTVIEQISNTRDQQINYNLSPWLASIALLLLILVYLPKIREHSK